MQSIRKTFISHMNPGYFCDFVYLHMYNARHFDSFILSDAMYTGFLTVELSRVIINVPSEQSAHFITEEVFTKSTIKAVQKHSTPKVNESTNLIIHLKNSICSLITIIFNPSGFLPPKLYIKIYYRGVYSSYCISISCRILKYDNLVYYC